MFIVAIQNKNCHPKLEYQDVEHNSDDDIRIFKTLEEAENHALERIKESKTDYDIYIFKLVKKGKTKIKIETSWSKEVK